MITNRSEERHATSARHGVSARGLSARGLSAVNAWDTQTQRHVRRIARQLVPRSVAGLVLGWLGAAVTLALDRVTGLALPAEVGNARTLLGALVGAILTIAVFTLWMRTVVVGLAASEISPRVVSNYLDDAFQRRVTGWMITAFAYVAAVVMFLPGGQPGGAEGGMAGMPAISTLVSVLVATAALLGVLLAIRQAVTDLSPSHLVRTLAERALDVMQHPQGPNDTPPSGQPGVRLCDIGGRAMGWVQHIDYEELIDALPPGATLTTHAAVGDFLAPEQLVASADVELGPDQMDRVLGAFTLTKTRDANRDLTFAIQQLVDVAQHAMGPSSNDTSTAEEALAHLRVVFRALLRNGKFTGCRNGSDDRHVVSTTIWHPADHIETAFERLRRGATEMPTTASEMLSALDELIVAAEQVDDVRSRDVLRRQQARLRQAADRKEMSVTGES